MLIIDTFYISRYKKMVWHPLISRYSYSTRKCTCGCANTTVPTSLFIHMKKIPNILHICNKWIGTPFSALSEYPFTTRFVMPLHERQIMSIICSWRPQFPIAFLINVWLEAGVWRTVDVTCSCGAVVTMWLSSVGEWYGSTLATVSLLGTNFGWPPWKHNDSWCFLLNDIGNWFSN